MRCFIHLFPDQKVARSYKVKEQHVVDALRHAELGLPAGLSPVCDRVVNGTGACGSKRRPDWLVDLSTHSIIVEVDENQHVAYEDTCESKRLMQLFEDLGSRPLVVVRFNPDGYMDMAGRRVPPAFTHHRSLGVPMPVMSEWQPRRDALIGAVRDHIKRGVQDGAPCRELTIVRLFFDS